MGTQRTRGCADVRGEHRPPRFGEVAEVKKRTSYTLLESHSETGVFLGTRLATTDNIVGNNEGIFALYSIQRKPDGERSSLPELQEIPTLAFGPNPGAERQGE